MSRSSAAAVAMSAAAAKNISVVSDSCGRSGSRGTGARCGAGCASSCSSTRRVALSMQLADLLVEVAEEVVGHLLGSRIHQARADLRQLAADVGLHVVLEAGRLAL